MKTGIYHALFMAFIFFIISCDREKDLALVFTVDDIQSYRISSEEIIFTDAMYDKIISGNYNKLTFSVDNKPLLENILLVFRSESVSHDYITLSIEDDGIFRLINATQQFDKEWDTFIKCLSDAGKLNPTPPPPPPVELTIDDIKSYHVTTFEIEFTDSGINKLEPCTFTSISLYFEDKPLLGKIQRRGGPLTTTYNDLVIVIGDKSYLADGFPVIMESEWDGIGSEYGWDSVTKEKMRKERAENAKKREVEWNLFIRYLTDAGKIVK